NVERDPVFINAELVAVCGSVTDMNGNPLGNALLRWKSGGESFTSNAEGQFLTTQTEGKHILVAQLPGYKDTEMEIVVTKPQKSSNTKVQNVTAPAAGNFLAPAVKNLSATKPASAASFISAGSMTSFSNGVSVNQAVMGNLVNAGDIVNDGTSCGHVVRMRKFYVKAVITDEATGKTISNATVEVEYNESTKKTTDAAGVALVTDVPSPSGVLIIKGPAGSLYIPVKKTVAIDNSRDTMEIAATLKTGCRISGKVFEGSTAVKNAEVVVVGMEHISVRSDAAGNYVLPGVPVGEFTLRASKAGLLADDSTITTESSKSYTVDFSLKDPGFDAASLLGFKLVLHKSEPGAAPNEFRISGELVEIPDNMLFKKKASTNLKIPFTNALVIKSGTGIVPKDGVLKTDVSEIPLTVFNWVQVKLRNGSGLQVKALGTDNSSGQIIGELAFDVTGTFSSLTNWKIPFESIKLAMGTETMLGALTSTGSFTGSSFKLNGPATGWEVYGVKITPDLANSEISTAGLNVKGKLEMKDLPVIGTLTMTLKNLQISKTGSIGAVDLELSPKPQITLSAWNLTVEAAAIDPYGFKFTGNMKVPIPSSPEANIGFSDLGISAKTGITGGKFYLPDVGLNIFEIVKFKAGAEAIALQKLPSSPVYQFVGSGSMSLPKFIKNELKVDNFTIRSDWNFSAKVQTDFTVGFADMAALTITKVGISTAPAGFDIGGKFKLQIPNFGIGAGGEIHYRQGGAVSVDDLAIAFNLSSAVGMSASVKFAENEYAGSGFLKIPGLSSGVGLQFLYRNLPGGKLVKADFNTGVIIPIGIVKLDQLGGGFSCNTATSIYSVTAKGRITFAADPAGLLALNPVSVTITSTPKGPIFEGGANVVLMNSWKIGEASMKIDFPDKYFFIDGKFGGGFTLMKGFNVDAAAGLHIEASAQSGNSYWMMAGYTKVAIPYICNTGVLIAGGWNVAKTVHESLSGVPDYALYNGKLYGGYFGAFTSIGADPPPIGVKGLATLDAWYRNEGNAEIYGNVKAASYGVKFNALWSAGASADFLGMGVASASLNVKGGLEGYYTPSGWSINGNLGCDIHAHIGCNGGCNGITWGCCFNACVLGCEVCPCPCGVKICAGGSVNIGYSSASGFSFGLNVF
ncbi:MAG TPA: carboxypeptidase regulatory-like domain-containing protein, partial [Flavisolibacter sp.]